MTLPNSILALLFGLILAAAPALAEPISIVAVGDLLLGGSAAKTVEKRGFGYPFADTADDIRQADLAMANLEAPLTARGEKHPDKTFTFRVPPAAAKEIRAAGFDLMTLANNHIGDYGEQGVLDTLESLKEAGLGISGAGRNIREARTPYVAELNGASIAFLSYSNTFPKSFYASKSKPGTAPGYFEYVATDIRRARKQHDYVIASFHWGGERMHEPKDYQMELGRLAIDSGANVVIGHHPHVLQGAELYKNGVIYYSLGNFAFGSYSESSVTAGMARVWLDEGKLLKAEILPLNVFNAEVHFQPKPLLHDSADDFARNFNAYSAAFETQLAKQSGPFWEIVKGQNTEDSIDETEEVLAQGKEPDSHQGTKATKNGENPL